MTDDITDFERVVIEEILAGDEPSLAALQDQLASCRVSGREFTGRGFSADLAVDRGLPPSPLDDGDVGLGDVLARIPGLEYDAGFVLFVRDGYLDMLEGYSYGEPWPASVDRFEIERVEVQRGRFLGRPVSLRVVRGPVDDPQTDEPFVCFLAWDAERVVADEIERMADRLLDAGASYFCCWGRDCERVHDGIDEVIVARGVEDVLTTWHPDESLAEALEFALLSAHPPAGDVAPVRMICVGAAMGRDLSRALGELRER